MPANPDFKDLFRLFNEEEVEYLVVGAHAVIFYAEPRYTKDLDIWVNPARENAGRVYQALKRFGAPLRDIKETDFTDADLIYQVGIAPNRIDVLMSIAGVDFCTAWADRVESRYDNVPIHILGKASLIKAKQATGRPQDLLDIDRLKESSENDG